MDFDSYNFAGVEKDDETFSFVFMNDNGHKVKRKLVSQQQIDELYKELENIDYKANRMRDSIPFAVRTAMNFLRRSRYRRSSNN